MTSDIALFYLKHKAKFEKLYEDPSMLETVVQQIFLIEMINLKKGFFAWPVEGERFQRVRGIKKYNNISSRLLVCAQ